MPQTFYQITKNEKHKIRNKFNKNWNRIALGVKLLLIEVKMTNKVLREKPDCVVCESNKSRFLKQKHNNKK